MTDTDIGTSGRTDLLALTEDSLAALANRGLVKRAVKELAAGTGAGVAMDADGALRADFPDGVVVHLRAETPLADATCSCAAAGLCRHRIGLVLAYQMLHAASASKPVTEAATEEPDQTSADQWTPGDIPDDALERAFGARSLDEARRTLKSGFQAVVHRPGVSRQPRVELPTCTVTFHIAGDPAYATTDAIELKRGEAVTLAVWAFRAADELGFDGESAHVSVGGASATPSSTPTNTAAAATALSHAVELVETLLLEGVSAAGPLLVGNLQRASRDLAAASLHWPAAIIDELIAQLDWYLQRNARYELSRLADLATELLGRARAATLSVRDPRLPSTAQILGSAEPARTELRRIRLIGLGCRISAAPQHRMAELYFAHPHDGTVLVLRREWRFEEAEEAPSGAQLRTRRVAGAPLHALAACNLVSEAASRSASRTVAFGAARLAKTTVTPVGEAWSRLPSSVRVQDFAALAQRLSARDPRFLRPRVEAEDIYVLMVSEVEWVGYDPAAQCLEAVVRDHQGTAATIRAPYRAVCPPALDALGAALTASETSPLMLMISGRVTVRAGELVVDPIAVWGGGKEQPVVLDLAVGDDTGTLPVIGRRVEQDAVTTPLHDAVEMLAEHAHRGLDRAGEASRAAVEHMAASLSRAGFNAAAALLAAYGGALLRDDRAARARAWVDASIVGVACLELNG
jgi:hypothetical protein